MGRFDILTEKSNDVMLSEYKSDFDFEKYEIEDEKTKNKITKNEEEVMKTGRQIAKKTLELGKILYETQELLSNYKDGVFVEWFKYMNLEKNFVYREIDRWKLFLKHKNPKIAEASIRTIDFIKKNDEILEENKINQILEEPRKASEKIKEIKDTEILEKNKKKEVEYTREELDKKIEKKCLERDKIYEKLEKLEQEIEELQKKRNGGIK